MPVKTLRPSDFTEAERARFWSFVAKTDGCWRWRGPFYKSGYGAYSAKVRGRWRLYRAHRVAYVLTGAELAGDVLVCHACDNPSCVNPEHLWPGTHKDNHQDRERKMRGPNSKKTHCPLGHPYSGSNLIVGAGGRKCRACKRARYDPEWQARYWQANKHRWGRG